MVVNNLLIKLKNSDPDHIEQTQNVLLSMKRNINA